MVRFTHQASTFSSVFCRGDQNTWFVRNFDLRVSESLNQKNVLLPTQKAQQLLGELCSGAADLISAPCPQQPHGDGGAKWQNSSILGMEFGFGLKNCDFMFLQTPPPQNLMSWMIPRDCLFHKTLFHLFALPFTEGNLQAGEAAVCPGAELLQTRRPGAAGKSRRLGTSHKSSGCKIPP